MTNEDRGNATEDLRLCLGKAGFSLKGFTFSGQDPDSTLSIRCRRLEMVSQRRLSYVQ